MKASYSAVETARDCARYLISRERGNPGGGQIDSHSLLTARLAARFVVEAYGASSGRLALQVEIGARLHDIGQYAVSPLVILKPASLTAEEEALVREHPRAGAAKIEGYREVECARDVVLHHHEWWDGTGYPDGLEGGRIPLAARIVSVFDTFASLVAGGAYHGKHTVDEALSVLRDLSGRQFDPELAGRVANYLADGNFNCRPAGKVAGASR